MDTENIISHSRARFDHAAARRTLKEKYQAKMIFGYNGGMFRAGPELLNTLMVCPDQAVILDLYDVPISIQSSELKEMAQQRWQEQMNGWLAEYREISRNR